MYNERFTRRGISTILFDGVPNFWQIINSELTSYFDDFNRIDNGRTTNRIVDRLRTKDRIVAIDLFATTQALRGLKKLFQTKSLKARAVGMDDYRLPLLEKPIDQTIGISLQTGPLQDSKTWIELEQWLQPDTADIIFCRPYGGLYYAPTNRHYYHAVMGKLWPMINPNGGALMLQIPPHEALERLGVPIDLWLQEADEAGINYGYVPRYVAPSDSYSTYGLLVVEKTSDAPEYLPHF